MRIINGRWVRFNGDNLDPIEMNGLKAKMVRIKKFLGEEKEISHDRIDILNRFLVASEAQEKAISKVLEMGDKDLKNLLTI